jgi:small redox-active disulfide protein 2
VDGSFLTTINVTSAAYASKNAAVLQLILIKYILRRMKMLTIKVLGPGCENCQKVEQITRKALAMFGIEAQVIKVTDWAEIKKYPILGTPGLVINEKVVCAGRIPTESEVTTWLANAMPA